MEELELSIMSHGYDPAGDVQPLLDQFAGQYHCRVRLTMLPWEKGWGELVKVALYKTGADVSEIGANWVGSLVAMNALRPIASWVWNAGGDFISADGKRTLFDRAESRTSFRAYFSLGRYLAGPARDLDSRQADGLFQQAAAVTISGPWLFLLNQDQPEVIADIGIALPPAPPFVGGSNLIVWQHVPYRRERLTVELVRFLTSRQVQARYCQQAGLLPVRLDVLNASPFSDQPHYQVMAQGLKAGRSFPSYSLCGLVEDWLTAALARIWEDVWTDPHLDLDKLIAARLGRLAQWLDLALGRS